MTSDPKTKATCWWTLYSFARTLVGKRSDFKRHKKSQCNSNKFVSKCDPHSLREHIQLNHTATAIRYSQFATLPWMWNHLWATVVADRSRIWPYNAVGYGTLSGLLQCYSPLNSSQTSYHKLFCSRSWHPYGSAISSSLAMVSQRVSSSAPLTLNKIQLWKYLPSAATSHTQFKRSPQFSSCFPQQFPLYYIIYQPQAL